MPTYDKEIVPIADLLFDMALGPVTPESMDERACLLKRWGFRRMHAVVPFIACLQRWRDPDEPYRGRPASAPHPFAERDPMEEAVRAGHRHGLEVFAEFKPYEGGGHRQAPARANAATSRTEVDVVGGVGCNMDPFLVEHPELRLKRRPDDDEDRLAHVPVSRIECTFCLDNVFQTQFDHNEYFPAQPDSVMQDAPIRSVRLWTSTANTEYRPYEGPYELSERFERKHLYDVNGRLLSAKPFRCRVLTIAGLEWGPELSYLAVSFDETHSASLVTIPYAMVQAYSATGEPATVCVTDAFRLNKKSELATPADPRLLCEQGFEFEKADYAYWDPGWRAVGQLALARGKNAFLKGTLCEACPEVRAHWLSQAQWLIDIGVDGIEIRTQGHSNSMTDWQNYGFNEPLVKAYRDRHGVDILAERPDPLSLMRLRGDFFLDYLQELGELLHLHGRVLQVQAHGRYEHARMAGDFNDIGFWATPKILPDWRRLVDIADEVNIKDYNIGVYNPRNAAGIKARAHAQNKPVWVHCYNHQGSDLNPEFLAAAQADPTVDGLALYELVHAGPPRVPTGEGLCGVGPDGRVTVGKKNFNTLKTCTKYGGSVIGH